MKNDLIDFLHENFGFSSFRDGQKEIITNIIENKNVLAVLPTGAGKSLCYQLPALLGSRFSIVISPLIALMKDQVDNLNKVKAVAEFINSTMDFRETESVYRRIEDGTVKLLFVAPERLTNLVFAERVRQLEPDFLFVDEAHCISEWGHNFRPSYRKIKDFIDFTGITHISAFTATATPEVVNDIIMQLGLKEPKVFVRGFERKNLNLEVHSEKHKRGKLLEVIRRYGSPAIVYTASRKTAEEINEFLTLNGFVSRYYHAGQEPIIRKHTQDEFISGRVPIIVATNAFGMGIDKKDIRLVVHYNMPGSIENYYQEIGRAGRDGKDSHAVLLYEKRDEDIHRYFIAGSYPQKEFIKGVYDALCDYGKIALGTHTTDEIIINYDFLKSVLKLEEMSRALVHAAVRILEDAGHMRLISELSKKYSFRFLVPSDTLKNYIKQTTDHFKKMLLLQLLRFFGSKSFQEKIFLSIAELSAALDSTETDVAKALEELSESGLMAFNKPSIGNDAVQLTSPRISSERLNVDYRRINETFLNAHKKLNEMIQFVFSGSCRFKFVLHYFGQQTENYRCGKCDNCTTTSATSDEAVIYVQEIVLRLLLNNKEGFKIANLLNLLRGRSSSTNYRQNKEFGLLRHYTAAELTKILDVMLNKSLIKYDFHQKKRLLITNSGIELLSTNGIIENKLELKNYEENLELFHLLKEARNKAASRFNQSAFLICSDEILRKIMDAKPDTKPALMEIEGFTERMFNKFGLDIIELMEDFLSRHPVLPTENGQKPASSVKPLASHIEDTYRLVKEGYSLQEIASLLHISEPVVSMQIETIIEYNPNVSIEKLVPPELIKLLKPKINRGIKEIKELKKNLGDQFTYPEIRIAAAKIRALMQQAADGRVPGC